MQQDNNIEKLLRELDDQQQPDLSQMDDHWQQMQSMLQPGAVPVQKTTPFGMIAGGTIISILVVIGVIFFSRSSNDESKTTASFGGVGLVGNGNTTEKFSEPLVVPVKDTVEKKQAVISLQPEKQRLSTGGTSYKSKYASEEDSLLANMHIQYTPCGDCNEKKNDGAAEPKDRQEELAGFFSLLKKEPQQFTVNNSRDTLLKCAEGSLLLIPANSFDGKTGVEISVKEFYKGSDIILNQLSTMSNKDQLVTGGMLYIKATLDGKDVAVNPSKPLRLFMTDTSSAMSEMQLFNGKVVKDADPDKKVIAVGTERPIGRNGEDTLASMESGVNGVVNWLPQYRYFTRKRMVTQVRVLNLVDQPYKVKNNSKGEIGYFMIDSDSLQVEKSRLKELLKEKYGYYKVRLRQNYRSRFWITTSRDYNPTYAHFIGDSIWMDKDDADKYKLGGILTRQIERNEMAVQGDNNTILGQQPELMKIMKERYSVDIRSLGWINCDRFYNDPREKMQYAVNIGEPAMNYYTMLLFDDVRSMMNGYADGNKAIFYNVPKGAKVKVISIGVNQLNNTVYAIQQAIIGNQELTGLQFQTTSIPDLKASLSKNDR